MAGEQEIVRLLSRWGQLRVDARCLCGLLCTCHNIWAPDTIYGLSKLKNSVQSGKTLLTLKNSFR